MPRAASGVYGGLDAEQRRVGRRAQLLEAALERLGSEGWQGTTVRSVCARAQLTPRYFYESFGDLDELLLAVFDRIAEEAAATVLEAVQQAPDDARLKARAAIGAFVALVTDDRRKARVLFVEAMGSEPLARRRFDALRMFSQLVAGQARDFYGLRGTPDPVVELSALMVVGGLAETLLAWIDGTLPVAREQLIEDCADLFVATGQGAVALARARETAR